MLAGLLSCGRSPGVSRRESGRLDVRELPVQEPPAAARSEGAPEIRVAVFKDISSVRITGGKARRVVGSSGREFPRAADELPLEIRTDSNGLTVNGVPAAGESALTIESANPDELLSANGQELSRRVRVHTTAAKAGVLVVAQLAIEEYLAGVLAGEVPFDRWHAEALKAQAITSRSYAFQALKRRAAEPYDVESTVMSQVFKSGYRNNPTLSAALNSTRGQVLTCEGSLVTAYFHSTCGDHTEPAGNVFPEQSAVKPLAGVSCGFCAQSPAFRWTYSLSKNVLAQKLKSPSGKVECVEFLDASGRTAPPLTRAVQVRINHGGSSVTMSANQFRLLVGARELKSMLIERVTDNGETIEISGAGYGHGVGLCQWGSQGMAQAGYSCAQILGKYFPGAALTKMW